VTHKQGLARPELGETATPECFHMHKNIGCGPEKVILDKSWKLPDIERGQLTVAPCPFVAQSGHAQCADECPLLGAKRTLIDRWLTNLDL
jgi:hypothetical protein